jgi:hypothetical protein
LAAGPDRAASSATKRAAGPLPAAEDEGLTVQPASTHTHMARRQAGNNQWFHTVGVGRFM